MKRKLVTIALAICICGFAVADDKAAKFETAKLVGEWSFVAGAKQGETVAKERMANKITVTKENTFILPTEGGMRFVMAFKIDDKEMPAKIDMQIKEGPVPEGKASGIIELKGDEFKICYVPEGGERPKKFESTKDNGAFYFTLKRVKKDS